MKLRSPIRWFGGKHFLAPTIISLMPEHHCYVEPFGGGANVLTQKPPSPVEIYNDTNHIVVNFLLQLRKDPERMISALKDIPYSRALFEKWKWEEWPQDDFDKAVRWFYINRCQIEGETRHRSGWAHSKEKNKPIQYRNAVQLLKHFSDRFKSVQIDCRDFREVIENYDGPDTLFYCDPPYRGTEYRYLQKFTDEDHQDLAKILKNIQGKVMVSYYHDELIDQLYEGWNYIEIPVQTAANVSRGEKKGAVEVLYMNFEDPQLSIYDVLEEVT